MYCWGIEKASASEDLLRSTWGFLRPVELHGEYVELDIESPTRLRDRALSTREYGLERLLPKEDIEAFRRDGEGTCGNV